jgi:hypothetical protein
LRRYFSNNDNNVGIQDGRLVVEITQKQYQNNMHKHYPHMPRLTEEDIPALEKLYKQQNKQQKKQQNKPQNKQQNKQKNKQQNKQPEQKKRQKLPKRMRGRFRRKRRVTSRRRYWQGIKTSNYTFPISNKGKFVLRTQKRLARKGYKLRARYRYARVNMFRTLPSFVSMLIRLFYITKSKFDDFIGDDDSNSVDPDLYFDSVLKRFLLF